MIERVKTGIVGFDKIIGGGLIKKSVNLISGGPGTGKTIFSISFLHNGAINNNEKGVYFSFEESGEDLREDVLSMNMNFNELTDKIRFVHVPPYTSRNFLDILKKQLDDFKPQRVVIDSVSGLGMGLEDNFERRKEIFNVINMLKNANCTTIITSEIPHKSENQESAYSRFGVEEFLCDSLILLDVISIVGNYSRSLTVRKMRKTKHNENIHAMNISEIGLIVKELN